MKIKEARKQAGYTQQMMSIITGIPKRTIEDWECDRRTPSKWVERLVINEILRKPDFKIKNQTIENYANICKKFSHDTDEWLGLVDNNFYTARPNGEWKETSDNAIDGVDVSWSFHLSDDNIEKMASEELFEKLMQELDLAESDGWSSENFKTIYKKFDF